jgi:predicted acylesterase/phospholipase RssA
MFRLAHAHALAVLLLTLLSACATPRPAPLTCPGFGQAGLAGQADDIRLLGDDRAASGPIAEAVDQLVAARAQARSNAPVVINYLVMSTGGQYGAFGSGFLQGWAENRGEPRPVFDVVTGASAGGVIAPFAFAGAAFDDRLTLNAGIGTEDVLRPRSLLEALGSPSLMDVSLYEARIRAAIDAPLLAALAQGAAEGRSAFVGTVNMDTSAFEVVDIAALAALGPPGEPCIEEALLATSAIPGLFPPRNVNGFLYADAGLRDHVFFAGVRQAIGRARAAGIAVQLNAYIIINGDLRTPVTPVEHNLRDLAVRAMSITTDQGLRTSVLELIRLGQETRWNIRAITAREVDLSACGGAVTAVESKEEALFDICTTNALFAAGRALGTAPVIPWLTADDLRTLAEGG